MHSKQKDEVILALIQFVLRAADENATPAQVAALPAVAQILLNL